MPRITMSDTQTDPKTVLGITQKPTLYSHFRGAGHLQRLDKRLRKGPGVWVVIEACGPQRAPPEGDNM